MAPPPGRPRPLVQRGDLAAELSRTPSCSTRIQQRQQLQPADGEAVAGDGMRVSSWAMVRLGQVCMWASGARTGPVVGAQEPSARSENTTPKPQVASRGRARAPRCRARDRGASSAPRSTGWRPPPRMRIFTKVPCAGNPEASFRCWVSGAPAAPCARRSPRPATDAPSSDPSVPATGEAISARRSTVAASCVGELPLALDQRHLAGQRRRRARCWPRAAGPVAASPVALPAVARHEAVEHRGVSRAAAVRRCNGGRTSGPGAAARASARADGSYCTANSAGPGTAAAAAASDDNRRTASPPTPPRHDPRGIPPPRPRPDRLDRRYRAGLEPQPVMARSQPARSARCCLRSPAELETVRGAAGRPDRVVRPGLSLAAPALMGCFPANSSLASVLGDLASTGLRAGPVVAIQPGADRGRGGWSTGCARWWACRPNGAARIQDTASTSTFVALL